jgi:hypothetical protein
MTPMPPEVTPWTSLHVSCKKLGCPQTAIGFPDLSGGSKVRRDFVGSAAAKYEITAVLQIFQYHDAAGYKLRSRRRCERSSLAD